MPATKVRDEGRLERLITLAYLLSLRSEIHIDELTERLGVDRKTLEADINILMFCGLPPYSPEQLFDIIIDDDYVSMYYNDVFIKPLQLTETEKAHAVISLVRLKADMDDDQAATVQAIIDVLDSTKGNAVVIDSAIGDFDATIRTAIEQELCIDITYLSMTSSSITTRTIEPLRIFTTASVGYVYAYCHKAKGPRIFRTDRILSAVLGEKRSYGSLNENTEGIKLFQFSHTQTGDKKDDLYVDLEIAPEASFIIDTYPNEPVDESKNIFRFYSPTAHFASRLIVAHRDSVRYVTGTITREAIVNALETTRARMTEN